VVRHHERAALHNHSALPPRIEPERDGWGWLVLLPSGHGWVCGDRRQALREFDELEHIERYRHRHPHWEAR
jgi:hypothetical protein